MKLSRLLSGVEIREIRDANGWTRSSGSLAGSGPGGHPGEDGDIGEVREDSRSVQPGDLFVAVPGQTVDGHRFIRDAVGRGAAAVLVERFTDPVAGQGPVGLELQTDSTARALALVAANRYGRPADELTLIGITGTNGKTTTSYLVESLLRRAGREPGLLGTLFYRYKDRSTPAPLTTPGSLLLHRTLRHMRDAGVDAVAMEVSSHALSLDRLHGLRFQVAAFTHLTQDHLDFHGDMESYFAAKARLFGEHLLPTGVGVVNLDGPYGRRMADRVAPARLITVSTEDKGQADIWVKQERLSVAGIEATLSTPVGEVTLRSPLIGRFNLANLALAAGIGVALGLSPQVIGEGLSALRGIPGRVQPVEPVGGDNGGNSHRSPAVFVDYAHTPDALVRVMAALRTLSGPPDAGPLPLGRLIVVFGCGGDRDRGKRPLMGEAAARTADLTIVTSDNPRTEDPNAIIGMILAGLQNTPLPRLSEAELRGASKGYFVEPDRRRAIRAAIRAARPADIVLIAGKGHEDYQIVGTTKEHFDDQQEARVALHAAEAAESAEAKKPEAKPEAKNDNSIELPVDRVLQATHGQLVRGGPRKFSAVVIDGRAAGPGALFVAVRGGRHDGHAFVQQAVERGATGVLVERGRGADLPGLLDDTAVIEVADTVVALGQIARAHRTAPEIGRDLAVVAVTGSSGKTTTKELLAAILAEHAPGATLKTEGNLNNHLGVPLTLLRLCAGTRYAVVEMGMSARGEIAYLTSLAQPDVGIITNAGPVHLLSLGTIENVALAKGELFHEMADGGTAIYPAGDVLLAAQAVGAGARSGRLHDGPVDTGTGISGSRSSADASGVRVQVLAETWQGLLLRLQLSPSDSSDFVDVDLPLLGSHNAGNAALAAAAALALDVPPKTIAAGLARVRPSKHRSEIREIAGRHIIDDCYNANPQSVVAALRTLASLLAQATPGVDGAAAAALAPAGDGQPRKPRGILVFGDMLELGTSERVYHERIGQTAAEHGVSLLVALGPLAAHAVEAAVSHGTPAVAVASVEEAAGRVVSQSRPGDIVLIKGSRGMQLERMLELLPAYFADQTARQSQG